MTFSDLKLIEPLTNALAKKGYQTPTPIQQKAIPHILDGKDLFGCAQTGTGKTAAFALPILQLLYERRSISGNQIRALILAPTRELAIQIGENFSAYGANLNLRHTVVFGGVSQVPQAQAMRKGVDILIATPGRLLDLMSQGIIRINQIELFVLDEADRMLDMGFIHDIKKILSKLPAQKQTLLFSATLPDEIKSLADGLLQQPVRVSVTPVSSAAEAVKQSVYYVNRENKRPLLHHVIVENHIDHALVFTRTKRGADRIAKDLNKRGIKAESIHGDKSQGARERALKGFKERSIRILVATDIASRGIDVDKLSHVINYEIPELAETYVHRIGRTGRAGESGTAISFCTSEEQPYMRDIIKLINKNIETIKSHPFNN
ncbi:MAG: DEAD/DEAH box helicase [Bacteroidota bacterium]|jgi:ATP-dependent RNA helicase RhlE|nr:DEAD/DEAH box helicase [Bacteroidota bacterium]GDX47807.1 DEAD/DEAH box family ATP-dependent RNA helicase [Bacteroidota bacterium]